MIAYVNERRFMHCVSCRYYNTIRLPYNYTSDTWSSMGERKSKSSPYMLFIDEQVDGDYCLDEVCICNLIYVRREVSSPAGPESPSPS